MSELAALERRFSDALERISSQVQTLKGSGSATQAAAQAFGARPEASADPEQEAQISALNEALEKERAANAQLSERVHQVKQRQETTIAQLERRLARLTEQLDLQSLEMLRLKKANSKLMDSNSALRDAQIEGFPDATLINKSISAELEALQAERRAEMAEMEEILAELKPLLAAEAG